MKKLITLLIALTTLSFTTFAETNIPAAKIQRIGTGWGEKHIYITLENPVAYEGCTSGMIMFDQSHTQLREIVSIALSAYHADTPVEIRVSGCAGGAMSGVAIALSR